MSVAANEVEFVGWWEWWRGRGWYVGNGSICSGIVDEGCESVLRFGCVARGLRFGIRVCSRYVSDLWNRNGWVMKME